MTSSSISKQFKELIKNTCLQYKNVRFTVYRTALKLRTLQKLLKLDKVDLPTTLAAISQFALTTGHHDSVRPDAESSALSWEELSILVKHVMKDTITEQNQLDNPVISRCITDFIFAAYNLSTNDHVIVTRIKCFFILLSNKCLANKYKSLFWIYCESGSHMLSYNRLAHLLTDCIQITAVIEEKSHFSDIHSTVENCLQGMFNGRISEDGFVKWMLKEPINMVWLPTMHRLTVAEKAKHDITCKLCKKKSFVGLRFQCLRCISYNVCQLCYLTTRDHKLFHKDKHPILEHCVTSTKSQNISSFGRTLRNIVTKRYKKKIKKQAHVIGTNDSQVTGQYHVVEEDSIQGSSSDGRFSLYEEAEDNTVIKQLHDDDVSRRQRHVSHDLQPQDGNFNRTGDSNLTDDAEQIQFHANERDELLEIIHNLSQEKQQMGHVTEVLATSNEHVSQLSARAAEETEMLRAQIDVLQEHNKSLLTEVQVLRSYVDLQQQTLSQSITTHATPEEPTILHGDVSMVSPLIEAHSSAGATVQVPITPVFMEELENKLEKVMNLKTVSSAARSFLVDISENTRQLLDPGLRQEQTEIELPDRSSHHPSPETFQNPSFLIETAPPVKQAVTSVKDVHVDFESLGITSDAGRSGATSEIESLDVESELNPCDLHGYREISDISCEMNDTLKSGGSRAEGKILHLASMREDQLRY